MSTPKKSGKSNFRRVKIKIIQNILLSIPLSIVLAYLCVLVAERAFKDPIRQALYTFADLFGISQSAVGDFITGISNTDLVVIIGAVFVVFVVFMVFVVAFMYRSLSRVSRYLEQIEYAVGTLLDGEMPVLPAELESVQTELGNIKTALRTRESQAKEAEQRKNDLVVYLAHDLKTPLTSVIGYLNLLRESPELTPELRAKYTDITLDKAQRLEDLINEFFDITRFNLQTMELNLGAVDLAILLSQMADELYPQVVEKGLEIELSVPNEQIIVADGEKLHRVFDNLLKNAVSYSVQGGKISITSQQIAGFAHVAVKNASETIPQSQLEVIFEKFYRLDSARTSRTGGTGLGLAIAKEIVELHGGSIRAISGDGFTEFSVNLPLELNK